MVLASVPAPAETPGRAASIPGFGSPRSAPPAHVHGGPGSDSGPLAQLQGIPGDRQADPSRADPGSASPRGWILRPLCARRRKRGQQASVVGPPATAGAFWPIYQHHGLQGLNCRRVQIDGIRSFVTAADSDACRPTRSSSPEDRAGPMPPGTKGRPRRQAIPAAARGRSCWKLRAVSVRWLPGQQAVRQSGSSSQ